ncbi:hypothetical protein Bca52824_019177 [Brassica carinata]|uniref:Uncharacterized protein n=1 Tax=Brassica carinata TaxID=52824 RepID=A0A8X7VRI6_BRACI|nr:hypothetical protein Bca52824_019177 [Brassica carinata]
MGNCLGHNNDLAGKEQDDLETEPPKRVKDQLKESQKVVRIKVVVTKEKLRQILGHTKDINSIQHLVHVLKHDLKDSGRNISRTFSQKKKNISRAYEEEKELSDESWRLTLESIPENHY